MSSVALQAQGHTLPPRSKPPLQKVPYGVSIIQDPAYMGQQKPPTGQQRSGSIRDIRQNNIHAQRSLESNFHKPNNGRSEQQLDQLYFKGGNNVNTRGQRISKYRNASSHGRVFGLDTPLEHGVPNRDSSNYRTPQENRSVGRRQVGTVQSTSNLIHGNYGVDAPTSLEKSFKPYSQSYIRKPAASIQI